jgi:hypothetical protein
MDDMETLHQTNRKDDLKGDDNDFCAGRFMTKRNNGSVAEGYDEGMVIHCVRCRNGATGWYAEGDVTPEHVSMSEMERQRQLRKGQR